MSRKPARRASGALLACALVAPAAVLAGATSAWAATVGGNIASIASGQTGNFPCTLGGKGYVNPGDSSNYSCDGSGGKKENWCADFAAWAWAQAGVTSGVTSYLNGMAASFDTYGADEHTISSTPHLGDAVVFENSSGSTIEHVGLVTGLPGGSKVTITSGNDYYVAPGTSSSVAADIEANGQVQTNTYADSAVGSYAEGWYIKEYVSPVGGGPSIPPGFNVAIDANGSALTSGETVTGTVNLTAMASAQNYINSLSYTITGPNGYTDTIPGGTGANDYAQSWNTGGLQSGSYSIKAVANEIDGQDHTYGPIGFTVGFGPNPLPGGGWEAMWHGEDDKNPTGSLWLAPGSGTSLTAAANDPDYLGLAAGTSPSMAVLPDGSWVAAWHGADTTNPTGSLWIATGTGSTMNAVAEPGNLGVAAGSSPSIVAMPNGSWTVAWHGADTITPAGSLWVATGNGTSLNAAATSPGNLGVAANTSPSLVAMPNGTWMAAWHGADSITPAGSLWVATGNGTSLNAAAASPGNLGVAANTSPSLVVMPNSSWTLAWHGADTITPAGSLWVATGNGTSLNAAATSSGNLGVAANTSPSLTAMSNGTWTAAWHGADTITPAGSLWVATGNGTSLNAAATSPGNLGVAANTSPSIVTMPNGTWMAAWHGADDINPGGSLWVAPGSGTGLTAAAASPGNLGMAAGSSPTLVP
ncbi:MAG TPA: CHAP domain-containing protein [Actinospica sp.]|jgi:hypothetical protein|nr:CHAP domain-containing protein [Actinospica sp.]